MLPKLQCMWGGGVEEVGGGLGTEEVGGGSGTEDVGDWVVPMTLVNRKFSWGEIILSVGLGEIAEEILVTLSLFWFSKW